MCQGPLEFQHRSANLVPKGNVSSLAHGWRSSARTAASAPSRAAGRSRVIVMMCWRRGPAVARRLDGGRGLDGTCPGVTASEAGHQRRLRFASDDLVAATGSEWRHVVAINIFC